MLSFQLPHLTRTLPPAKQTLCPTQPLNAACPLPPTACLSPTTLTLHTGHVRQCLVPARWTMWSTPTRGAAAGSARGRRRCHAPPLYGGQVGGVGGGRGDGEDREERGDTEQTHGSLGGWLAAARDGHHGKLGGEKGGRSWLRLCRDGGSSYKSSHTRQLTPQPSCLPNLYSWCAGGGGNSLAQFEKKKKAASQRAGRHDKVSIEGRGLTLRGA